jgi:IS6 family transposase
VIEADHGKLKRRIKPTLGLKSMKTAYATIKGFELMHALRKGQAKLWMLSAGIRGEVRLVERAFGLVPSIMTEAILQLEAAFA